MGFIAASIGGIYLNMMRKKGQFAGEIGKNKRDAWMNVQPITSEDEIPLSESMDKLTVQIALVFIAYIVAYLFMLGVNAPIETGILGNFG